MPFVREAGPERYIGGIQVRRQLRWEDVAILGGGGLIFLASFLPFYTYAGGNVRTWSTGLFPLALLPYLFGIATAVLAAIQLTKVVMAPTAPGGFTWWQLQVVAAANAVLLFMAYLFVSRPGVKLGAGFWLGIVGSILLMVGTVVQYQTLSTTSSSPSPIDPFWFSLEVPETIVALNDASRAIATFEPGQWYLATAEFGEWLVVRDDAGIEGLLPAHAAKRQGT